MKPKQVIKTPRKKIKGRKQPVREGGDASGSTERRERDDIAALTWPIWIISGGLVLIFGIKRDDCVHKIT